MIPNSAMDTEIVCPECGGIVGATEPGQKRCTCFDHRPATAEETPDVVVSADRVKAGAKVCRVCGCDLTGKKRYRDREGYLCEACNEQIDQEEALKVKCPDCGRKIKPAGLVEHRGKMICRRCKQDRLANEKHKPAKLDYSSHKAHEKRKVLIAGVVLLVLGVLVVLSVLKDHGRRERMTRVDAKDVPLPEPVVAQATRGGVVRVDSSTGERLVLVSEKRYRKLKRRLRKMEDALWAIEGKEAIERDRASGAAPVPWSRVKQDNGL